MGTVLLAWELGGGAGHCVKLAHVARGLIAEGHQVWIAARDLITARNVFASLNVNYVQAPYLATRPVTFYAQPYTLTRILHNTGFGDAESIEVLAVAWRNLFNAIKPGLLVCDHAPMALLASRGQKFRRVVLGTGFTVPPTVSPLPDLRYWLPAAPSREQLLQEEIAVVQRVNKASARLELPSLKQLSDLYADVDAQFLLTFRELDHYPNRAGTDYYGAWQRDGGMLPEWPNGGGPKIFGYLKPASPTWRLGNLLAFLRESNLCSLMYVAGEDPKRLAEFASNRLRFVSEPVDLRLISQQCDMAILNGNSGSVSTFLMSGVPMLNIPIHLEQAILSRRVADLGAGLWSDPHRPEQMMARLMRMLQDHSFRDAAELFRARYFEFDSRHERRNLLGKLADLWE